MDSRKFGIAVVQARMSSTRLPGKVLKTMGGRPMLELLLERVGRQHILDDIRIQTVLATSTESEDDDVAEIGSRMEIPVVRGPLDDVLGRFVQAVNRLEPDYVFRLTGDNPMLDEHLIHGAWKAYMDLESKLTDGAGISNGLEDYRVAPVGYVVDLVEADRLRWLHNQNPTQSEKEHVTVGFKDRGLLHPFQLFGKDYSQHRWTVDYASDFRYMSKLFASKGTGVDAREAIQWSSRHPHPRGQEE